MGFWEDVFKSQNEAIDWANSWLPEFVSIGGVPVPKEVVGQIAYGTPYTQVGLIMKIAVALQQSGANKSQIGAAILGATGLSEAAGPDGINLGATNAMGQLIIANIYRCSIEMEAGGRSIVNVVHVEGSSSGQEAAAAAAVLAAWKVATGPLTKLSSLISMVQVQAMDLSTSSGGIAVVSDTTQGNVGSSNSLATRGAAALIKWNGSTRARSTRGRLYYGPLMEVNIDTDGASLTSTALSDFNTAFTAFRTSLTGAGFTLQVASRLTSTATAVTAHSVETTIATQRRRIRS